MLTVAGGRSVWSVKDVRFGDSFRVKSAQTFAEGRFDDTRKLIALTHGQVDEESLTTSTVVKAAHVTELRTAVNAVRAAAGLGAATWTNGSLSGAWLKEADVTELRTNLGDAINLLGLTAPNYTDTTLTNVPVKKAHFDEIRFRVK